MSVKKNTEQEEFWKGEFGDEYIDRNTGEKLLASNISFFSDILKRTGSIESIIEFGANVGMNLKAINSLIPDVKCSAVEINHKAATILKEDETFEKPVNVYEQSITGFNNDEKYDLSLIKGVLIHINPNDLQTVYEKLYNSSKKWVLICEYYNPTPITVTYRGNENKLFKRDFAGEFMKKYTDVKLVDYGFKYHNDPVFPQDDITWFLLRKE